MKHEDKCYPVEVLEIEIMEQKKARNKLSLVPNTYDNQGVGQQFHDIAERIDILRQAIEIILNHGDDNK